MATLTRSLSGNHEFPEVSVVEYIAKRGETLQKDLLSVGHKQQRGLSPRLSYSFVVKRRDYCFACARCRHDQVAPTAMPQPFNFELVKHLPLEWVRFNIKWGDRRIGK